MRRKRAGTNARIAAALFAGLALAGCSDVDDALFGRPQAGDTVRPVHAEPAPGLTAEAPPPAPAEAAPEQSASEAPPPVASSDLGPRIAAVNIAPGRETGTETGKTISGLRGNLQSLGTKLVANARRLGQIRANNARLTANYQEARDQIQSRLKGSAPANPELIKRWNSAQSALDKLTTILNETGTIGNTAATDSASAQTLVQKIESASAAPDAVDEDHRQLDALEDEARQMIISIDRLRKEVAADVPRETSYLTGERATLAHLQAAIKSGGEPSAPSAAPQQPTAQVPAASPTDTAPLITIKFDKPHVDYQKDLFAALTEALKTKPRASFQVLAVAPVADSVATMQAAQSSAKKHASEVVQTMTSMGVPASRVVVTSLTDPSIQQSEVRVFAR